MLFNWQQKDWPKFKYDLSGMEELLFQFATEAGRMMGLLQTLPNSTKEQSIIDIMVTEALKTSAIEGEYLSRDDVLSSIKNNLRLNRFPEKIKDKRAKGVARLMVRVREQYTEELTESTLFEWHQMVMESYLNIQVGQWRSADEPMRVISGAPGRETIHFEAPPSIMVPDEMKRFMDWYNQWGANENHSKILSPVHSAIAHVYFESIHPFEDGNGRIGRALSEKALSQGLGNPILMSLSTAIETDRKAYYKALKTAQRSNEITSWIRYFLNIILSSQQIATKQISFTITKSRFFDQLSFQINPRQEKVLNRMFEAGPDGFKGGMSARKYISITKTSKATATRDLQQLVKVGALIPLGRGRSRRYELNF